MTELVIVTAWGAKRLLGERCQGVKIPLDARYFWDGEYYRVDALQHDPEARTITMPDGVVLPEGTAIHLYSES